MYAPGRLQTCPTSGRVGYNAVMRQHISRRWLPFFAVHAVCIAALLDFATAADRRAALPVADFEIGAEGDLPLVPVTVGGKEYPFLVSTGMATTMVDETLREKFELFRLETKAAPTRRGGGQPRERYGGLNATLGKIALEFPNGILVGDYTAMREKLDLEVYGEIGMDVLQNYVVQIDFDEGKLRLLTALPGPAGPAGIGEAVRITPLGGEGGAPTIAVTITGLPAEKYIVSTSRAANALEVRGEVLTQLEEKEKATILDKDKGVTRSGTLVFTTARLEGVQIGKFRHEGLIVNSAEQSTVGQTYLSRFVVTFDFLRNRMYLREGQHFRDPDILVKLWAVEIDRDEEAPVVRHVHGQGAAGRMGLRNGDVVEQINGHDARRMTNWQVRRLLGQEERPVTALVRRGDDTLTLESERAADRKAAD